MQRSFFGNLDILDEYARQHENAIRRDCYARHPERVYRQRLRSAVYLLNRAGHLDKVTAGAILSAIGGPAR